MKDFFFENNEEKHGIAGFSIGGSDWLGLGQIAQAQSKGTEMCGAQPTCIGAFQGCKERQQAYADCVSRTLDLQSQQISANQTARNTQKALALEEAKRKKQITYAIIGAITLSLIVVIVVVAKRR